MQIRFDFLRESPCGGNALCSVGEGVIVELSGRSEVVNKSKLWTAPPVQRRPIAVGEPETRLKFTNEIGRWIDGAIHDIKSRPLRD